LDTHPVFFCFLGSTALSSARAVWIYFCPGFLLCMDLDNSMWKSDFIFSLALKTQIKIALVKAVAVNNVSTQSEPNVLQAQILSATNGAAVGTTQVSMIF
jgi:hypothetical protein